jgi:ADP-ribose pyrophosphatase YjhB (NUDIX family)
MRRHFTVTGFVVREDRTALHWHRLGMWLPPGGHVETDEDPVQAVFREVAEETGLSVEILPPGTPFEYPDPPQLPAPVAMAIYDIPGDSHEAAPHQHIDFIYFTRALTGDPIEGEDRTQWRWFDEPELRSSSELQSDVRELALAAIEAGRTGSATRR